jgi:predicted transport protein
MEDAAQTMISNLEKNYGKTLEQWIQIVRKEGFAKHGEIMKFLKDNHGFTHGFANLVAHKTLKSDAGSAPDVNELIEKQYKGKEHFLPIYEKLKAIISEFGNDIEFAPKNAYISVKRRKQFAMLIPATKTRYEIGINLKGQEPEGILEIDTKTNGMCSHKIHLSEISDIDSEVIKWIKKSYENAG